MHVHTYTYTYECSTGPSLITLHMHTYIHTQVSGSMTPKSKALGIAASAPAQRAVSATIELGNARSGYILVHIYIVYAQVVHYTYMCVCVCFM
jgi:hypothetical protein